VSHICVFIDGQNRLQSHTILPHTATLTATHTATFVATHTAIHTATHTAYWIIEGFVWLQHIKAHTWMSRVTYYTWCRHITHTFRIGRYRFHWKSRNSNFLVLIQSKSKSQHEIVPQDTEESEFLDLVDFRAVAFLVETVIATSLRLVTCMNESRRVYMHYQIGWSWWSGAGECGNNQQGGGRKSTLHRKINTTTCAPYMNESCDIFECVISYTGMRSFTYLNASRTSMLHICNTPPRLSEVCWHEEAPGPYRFPNIGLIKQSNTHMNKSRFDITLQIKIYNVTVWPRLEHGSCRTVLQCVAVCCSVLQCVAVCCSVLQCVAVCCSVLQCVAVCSSVFQRVAVCSSMLVCWTWVLSHRYTHTLSVYCSLWHTLTRVE